MRLLALQWNPSEADVLVASVHSDRMRIEQAFQVDLGPESGEAESQESPAQRLAAALKSHRLGRLPLVVALGRNSAELRHLTLPAAPDEELPDLVRFQALRQFNNLEEHWPLDFLPLEGPSDADRYVLAATVHPDLVEQAQQLGEAAGVKLARLVLRPCAFASLAVRRLGPRSGGTRLLVSVDGDEIDLAVMVDGRVTFLRQARLAGDPLSDPAVVPALVMELRRTLAAAQNQPGSRSVEGVVLLGAGTCHETVAKAMAQELSLPTELVDPFENVDWGRAADESLSKSPGCLAPLVGALWDEATATAPALDFLHPRRRPEPPSRRNTYALAGLAAAMLVLLVIVLGWLKGDQLTNDVRNLQRQIEGMKKDSEQAAITEKAAGDVEKWMADEVNWLNELQWLSQRFPPADEAILTGLKLNVNSGRAEMTLDGFARDVETVTKLDQALRDPPHSLAGKSKDKSDAKPPYGVQFRSSVLIEKGE
jgi:Tfp pilus assembly PilM family ATPase/outer membrane murein-binding lipoprotein Lpp